MFRRGVLLIFMALLAGCQSPDAPVQATANTSPDPGNRAGAVQAADGVTIHYDDQGDGEFSLVFVHGWNCDRSYWDAQREHFAAAHRVVTVDLAGHGDSGQNRSNWTMDAFADDVTAVAHALNLNNIVLIGHSMGGKVVAETATRLKGRLVAVVGADTFHNGGRATPPARRDEVLAELAADYAGYVRTIVTGMFVEESDPALRERVIKDMASAPYASAIGSRHASGNYDATAAIASLDVPLILISSDYRPTDLAHLEANARKLVYREMSGVGHFVMLEDPDTFNAHLAAALAGIT